MCYNSQRAKYGDVVLGVYVDGRYMSTHRISAFFVFVFLCVCVCEDTMIQEMEERNREIFVLSF